MAPALRNSLSSVTMPKLRVNFTAIRNMPKVYQTEEIAMIHLSNELCNASMVFYNVMGAR